MITYNYDIEFAWRHIQKDSIPSLVIAYKEAFDIDMRLSKDDEGIYLALEDGFEIISKEYVFDLEDFKIASDNYIDMMRTYNV